MGMLLAHKGARLRRFLSNLDINTTFFFICMYFIRAERLLDLPKLFLTQILWSLIFLAALGYFIYQLQNLFVLYLKREVTVNTNMRHS